MNQPVEPAVLIHLAEPGTRDIPSLRPLGTQALIRSCAQSNGLGGLQPSVGSVPKGGPRTPCSLRHLPGCFDPAGGTRYPRYPEFKTSGDSGHLSAIPEQEPRRAVVQGHSCGETVFRCPQEVQAPASNYKTN